MFVLHPYNLCQGWIPVLGNFRFGVCRAAVGYTWWDIYYLFFLFIYFGIQRRFGVYLAIKKGVVH